MNARRESDYAELANAVTHGTGLVLSVSGLVVLVVLAALRGTAWHVVGCSVYGASLVILYGTSTVYHSLRSEHAKRVFQVLDHSAIFLLIAGTYTPFTLVTLRGAWGWTLFGLAWGIAVLGIVYKAFNTHRFPVISGALYLAAGWLVVIAIRPVWHALPAGGFALLLAGGLAYSLGLIFFGWTRLRYHHAIWHLFVLAGSVCHYAAVLLYVVPRAAA